MKTSVNMKAEKSKARALTKPGMTGAKKQDRARAPKMVLQAHWELKKIERSPQKKGLLPKSHGKTSANPKLEETEAGVLAQTGKAGANNQDQIRTRNVVIRTKLELKNILVPTDFSAASKKAVGYAVRLAQRTGGKITLLHVIEPMPAYPGAAYPNIIETDAWLVEAKQALLTGGKQAFRKLRREERIDLRLIQSTLIREGTSHQVITQAARELEADLIIIATNGRTGLAHVLLGSTTERVVRHAPCPVLVVREKEREFLHA